MTSPKKPSRASASKRRAPSKAKRKAMEAAWTRTRQLVETMLEMMEQGIRDPAATPEQWERMFGPKASAVANLEKLVQVLVDLNEQRIPGEEDEEQAKPLTADELRLIGEFLAQKGKG